jgi:Methyltransferase domain
MPASPWNRLTQIRRLLASVREKCYTVAFRRFALRNSVAFRNSLAAAGYQVARDDDYYSPLPSVARLKANIARWNRPSALRGVEYDLAAMKSALTELLACYLEEFLALPSYLQVQKIGFGQGYTAVDALTLYMMIRHLKPRRYIEVGSGVSTFYCSLAAQRNAVEGHPVEITCIEPYPFEELSTINGIRLLTKKVEDVDISLFQQLQENDVLFIDSSHILRVDGDVQFLYLEVLPILNVGVVTHIHDIPYPFNFPYPPGRWIFGQDWPMFWNEPMVLQAFLAFNKNFRISLSTPLLRHFDEQFLKQSIPIYQSVEDNPNTFSSIWLKRIS